MTNAKRSSLVSILVFSLLLPAIFAIAPQTAFGITLLHEFAGGDGIWPTGSLTLSGSTLYGMTEHGGDYNQGVIFALTIPEPSTLLLLAPALVSFAALMRKKFRSSVEPKAKSVEA